MDIEKFRTVWKNQPITSYSQDELDSIYQIRQERVLTDFKNTLSWDLLTAILISSIFIITLQVLNLKTSNFWSVCMVLLTIQHILFYQLQVYLMKRYSIFSANIRNSLTTYIAKLKRLLWLYRLWPATLAAVLYSIYIMQFNYGLPIWQILLIGTFIITGVAILSNIISAGLVRKQYKKLVQIKGRLDAISLTNISDNTFQ